MKAGYAGIGLYLPAPMVTGRLSIFEPDGAKVLYYSLTGKIKVVITITRTNSADDNFQLLVKALDLELKLRDGDDHLFYAQLNKTDAIKQVIVAYDQQQPVGCGAIRPYTPDTIEVKRMFVQLPVRGQGIASAVLKELEAWSKELGYKKCILETGKNQPEAIALYLKNKYSIIPNYGHYQHASNSICFEKILIL